MNFIPPHEITSRIMTLMNESSDFLLIISPYIDIEEWKKMQRELKAIVNRNLSHLVYTKDEPGNKRSIQLLEKLGVSYKTGKNFHCKLFLNEHKAIVTSKNLSEPSDIYSIDLGYEIISNDQLEELNDFCRRYLNLDPSKISSEKINWQEYLLAKIPGEYGYPKIIIERDGINIKTNNNNYYLSLDDHFYISGILSAKEYEHLKSSEIPVIKGLNVRIQDNGEGSYCTINADSVEKYHKTLENFTTKESDILDSISEFILFTQETKEKLGWST